MIELKLVNQLIGEVTMEQEVVNDELGAATESAEPLKADEEMIDEEPLKCDETTTEEPTTNIDESPGDKIDADEADTDTNTKEGPQDDLSTLAADATSNPASTTEATSVEDSTVNDSVSTKNQPNESNYSHCLSCNRKQLKADMVRNGRYCNQQCAHSHATLLRVFKNPLQLPKANAKKKVMMKDGKLMVGNMGISSLPKVALPKRKSTIKYANCKR